MIPREVAITEVWLDEQARLAPVTIRQTVKGMGWKEVLAVVATAVAVWGWLLLT